MVLCYISNCLQCTNFHLSCHILVDLLFQNNGDTGFWQAISQLSQKSKSPIVLTATSTPSQLVDGNFKYEQIELQRPSIKECCAKMKEVAIAEDMALKQMGKCPELNDGLSLIADYFQCDIRKILNEMQLFHRSISYTPPDRKVFPRGWKLKIDGSNDFNTVTDWPIILGIEPSLIPRDQHTLITITGKNFLSTEPATLYMGGEICSNFKVVSDSKIVAVCLPLIVPHGVSKALVYKSCYSNPITCLTSKFIDIAVRKRCSNGLVLSTLSCPPSQRSNWNIEYDAPIELSLLDQMIEQQHVRRMVKAKAQQKRLQNEEDNGFMSSEEEMEFGNDDTPKPSKNIIIHDSSDEEAEGTCEASNATQQDVDPRTLLNSVTVDYKVDQLAKEASETVHTKNCSSTIEELEIFAKDMDWMSDVAFLEEKLVGLPMLSGAVEGLGSQSADGLFTDSNPADPTIDKLSKDSHQRPGFDSLCLGSSNKESFFYGNANAYMVRPFRQRERSLIIKSEMMSRGMGAIENAFEPEQSDQDQSDVHDSEGVEVSECGMPSSRIMSEDDMLLSSQPSPTYLLSSWMLAKRLKEDASVVHHSNVENSHWFNQHIQETKTKVLNTMSTILAPIISYDSDW